MEFDEMKMIWDAQNNKPLYTIDEEGLYKHIVSKKKKARHITNVSELLLIVANLASGVLIAALNFFGEHATPIGYAIAVWMLGTALYVLVSRIRRINQQHQFDRSMMGDLRHAVSDATYQVRLSLLMRWNMLPIAVFTFVGLWNGAKSIWIAIGALIFFGIVYYASRWEHSIYKSRKRELEALQKMLQA
ncbi:hypothetical protein [Chryseosolibacter indicus]|uniref:Uncharacterized protein n=1 Tax=Chryseosolibacter indicus TaxID=2782351 RepID=A0ABS5VWQ4_9BACT|nr:hypothetical protein [Chryseosolibacter indicus]MBT1705855.1 hypothetical protein [Chryseosolibacter indicus]